jgi:hypothetical protein
MNSKQEAKMNMYDAVISHCNQNPAIVGTVPAFLAALTAFSSKYSSLVSTAQLEINEISGVAINKSVARKNLAQQASDISSAVFALAAANNDNDMKEKARNPVSKLINLRDELLAPACQNIHDLANTNIAALALYGITAATLTSFQSAIDSYTTAIPAPRNAVSQRVVYAKNIKTLIKEADGILKDQMDKIAPQFKAANMLFYNTYKNNRIILDAATSSTQVTGTVLADVEPGPLSGGTIQVIGQSYTTTTDANGEYTLKIPVPGTYSLKFTHAGYQDKTINNVVVTLGQSTNLNVTLNILPS